MLLGAVIGLVAVLAGGAVGLFLVPKLIDRSDAAQNPPATTTTTQTTTETTAPVTGGDPAFAPTLNPLDDKGDSVILTWSDPTNGTAQFVVVDVTGSARKALVTVAPGTTTYTVENLDPNADQYCFQIIGLGPDDPSTQHGASASVCTNR